MSSFVYPTRKEEDKKGKRGERLEIMGSATTANATPTSDHTGLWSESKKGNVYTQQVSLSFLKIGSMLLLECALLSSPC